MEKKKKIIIISIIILLLLIFIIFVILHNKDSKNKDIKDDTKIEEKINKEEDINKIEDVKEPTPEIEQKQEEIQKEEDKKQDQNIENNTNKKTENKDTKKQETKKEENKSTNTKKENSSSSNTKPSNSTKPSSGTNSSSGNSNGSSNGGSNNSSGGGSNNSSGGSSNGNSNGNTPAPKPTYSCPNGYVLNGTKCTKTVNASLVCPEGTVEGGTPNGCFKFSEGVEVEGTTCPSGQVGLTMISLGGPDRYFCYPNHSKVYTCDEGYTLNGNKCSITIDATKKTKKHTSYKYTWSKSSYLEGWEFTGKTKVKSQTYYAGQK